MELEGSCTAYGGTQGMCGLRGNLFGSTSRDDTLFETRSFVFIVYLLGLLANTFFLTGLHSLLHDMSLMLVYEPLTSNFDGWRRPPVFLCCFRSSQSNDTQ